MNTDLTYGVNPYQDVAGMVKDYEKLEAKKEAASYDPDMTDIPKEYMEPSREGEQLVRKGRLNPCNGVEIPPTPKTRSSQKQQFGRISGAYLRGYDQIRWDR